MIYRQDDGFLQRFFRSEHVQSGEDGFPMLQIFICRHPESNALSHESYSMFYVYTIGL